MPTLRKTAGEQDAGRLLKNFVRGDMGVSYGQFSSLKMRGAIRVNGEAALANRRLCAGDVVTVDMVELAAPRTVKMEFAPVRILYECDDFYIVDKDAPLACQCSIRQSEHTLENRLAAYFHDPAFVFRPLNRLDKGTSGLMCAAKHAHSCQMLQKMRHTGEFVREYLAVVEGLFEGEATIELPIAKIDTASVRRVVDVARGKPSITHVRALAHANGRTLVRLRLETGRTHQIRLHLSHIGHPVTGDFLYGREEPRLPGRFALHSTRLMLTWQDERIDLYSPLPEQLAALL